MEARPEGPFLAGHLLRVFSHRENGACQLLPEQTAHGSRPAREVDLLLSRSPPLPTAGRAASPWHRGFHTPDYLPGMP
jgi:hypothetical protein